MLAAEAGLQHGTAGMPRSDRHGFQHRFDLPLSCHFLAGSTEPADGNSPKTGLSARNVCELLEVGSDPPDYLGPPPSNFRRNQREPLSEITTGTAPSSTTRTARSSLHARRRLQNSCKASALGHRHGSPHRTNRGGGITNCLPTKA